MSRKNMSVARVAKLTKASVGKCDRHNERKNESYENINVEPERTPFNVSFKSTDGLSYNEYFDKLIADGKISTRGLKDGATYFNEMVIDVNTEYFEEHGGYEFAREFFAEAYRFCCDFYGEERIVSAVMHADEINKEVSKRLGKEVYHYHLHVVAIPTVIKEIKWSARCKNEELRGKVREVIHQVSHSKMWGNTVPLLDEQGDQVLGASGKPVFRKSYSVLQDKLYEHMAAAGYIDFQRGERGSSARHLSSLQYQIEKDKARLSEIEHAVSDTSEKLLSEQVRYTDNHKVFKMFSEIESVGKKGITGKYTVSKEDFEDLTALAKEGLSSRGEIGRLRDDVKRYKQRSWDLSSSVSRLQERLEEVTAKYERLIEITKPYLEAMRRFPDKVKEFLDKLFLKKKQQHEQENAKPKRTDNWTR